MVAGSLALFVDLRFALMGLGLLAAYLGSLAFAARRPYAASLGTLGVAASIAWVRGSVGRYVGVRRSRSRSRSRSR